MSHLKLIFSCIAVIFLSFSANSQGSTNQIIVYVSNGTTNADLDNAANFLNSTVNTYNAPGQNIALLDWNGPFTVNGLTINSIAEVASYLASDNNQPPANQNVPEIDGGVENYYHVLPGKDPSGPGGAYSCVNNNLSKYAPVSQITLGIFDTGVEYEMAQNYQYKFKTVSEVNGPVNDYNGHGTHIGTIIDKSFHDVIQNVSLDYMIGNPFNDIGQSTIADVIFDMEDALYAGVDILNCSFSYYGGDETYDPLYLLLSSSIATNSLIVAAAGNEGNLIPESGANTYEMVFPASFSLDNILSVGSYSCVMSSTEAVATTSEFSNFSPIHIDILAPGEEIRSLDHLGNYVNYSGTSQSTAFVSAAAAAIGSRLTTFDPITVKCIIMTYASTNPSLDSKVVSSGVLDLATAINYTSCTENTVDLRESSELVTQKIYPNPFNDKIVLELNVEFKQDAIISIYNLTGQLLKELKAPVEIGKNEISINFDEIAFNNQYIVRVKSDDKTSTTKIIRQR